MGDTTDFSFSIWFEPLSRLVSQKPAPVLKLDANANLDGKMSQQGSRYQWIDRSIY